MRRQLTKVCLTCGGARVGQRDAPGAQRKTDPALTSVLIQKRLYAERRAVSGADRPPPVLIPGAARGACHGVRSTLHLSTRSGRFGPESRYNDLIGAGQRSYRGNTLTPWGRSTFPRSQSDNQAEHFGDTTCSLCPSDTECPGQIQRAGSANIAS